MNDIWFALDINPSANQIDDIFKRAQLADELGFDLITSQDHPYNRGHFDTMTMLTALAMKTNRVRIGTNVANLPLRSPTMLAKQVATLSVLANREIELGLGAGAFWRGVKAYGGQERTNKQAYEAFSEALDIIPAMWNNVGGHVKYEGQYYQVLGAQPGPAPAKQPHIWVGAGGPKMLHLTGAKADGWWISIPYVPPEKLLVLNDKIDEGAQSAGRNPGEIRRGYNLMGTIDPNRTKGNISDKGVIGNTLFWIDTLTDFYHTYRMDTFNFWPLSDAPYDQIERFANEIIPAVRANLT